MAERWVVGDMDEGILIVRGSRADCVQWAKGEALSERVLARHSYGGGAYDYSIGTPDDATSFFIARESAARAHGFDTDQPPVYGDPDNPHVRTSDIYWQAPLGPGG